MLHRDRATSARRWPSADALSPGGGRTGHLDSRAPCPLTPRSPRPALADELEELQEVLGRVAGG
eukprot:15149852-Alexandrium_andersonii.AAC.1